ncbi:MAG: nuclear transport factor 2 family protein [Deltaproteobacteria bacterium]|nr:nuclear transport factor 2 family protein [Deltaproteobacteria bacterium]
MKKMERSIDSCLRFFPLISLLMIFSVVIGCSHMASNRNLVDDLGSPTKTELLKQRAAEFWEAMVSGDLAKAYELYDPFLRARMGVHEFIAKHSAVKYRTFEIKNVKVEGNIGIVTLEVTYEVPKLKVFKREMYIPEKTEEFEDRWLYVYDNWYKEYYLRFFKHGIAFY